jgi:glucan phosphoethanolaminetransferase (alkaline phosphatase superfamily)
MLKETDIQKTVLEKIHCGSIPMHSRRFFVLRGALLMTIAALVLLFSLFVLSFVFFSVQRSGMRFLLEFGSNGLGAFATLFPWAIFVIFLVLLVALELIVREFSTIYRFSLLRIFLSILVIGILGSLLLEMSPLHASLLSAADNDSLPILGPLYEQIHDSHEEQGVYRGDITSLDANGFTISHNDSDHDTDDGTWNIVSPADFDLTSLRVGEKVYVGGEFRRGKVYAYGIRELPSDE